MRSPNWYPIPGHSAEYLVNQLYAEVTVNKGKYTYQGQGSSARYTTEGKAKLRSQIAECNTDGDRKE